MTMALWIGGLKGGYMIVRFKAGLGNQMFQYAFIRLLQEKYKIDDVKADFSYYEKAASFKVTSIDCFNIKIDKASSKDLSSVCIFRHNFKPHSFVYRLSILFESLMNQHYFLEPNRGFINPSSLLKFKYLDGYWQSWKYVNEIDSVIRDEFTPKNVSGLIDIINQDEESVFIGIRRGDYLKTRKARKHFYYTGTEYYLNAMDYMHTHLKTPVFYVFSNDLQWVKDNIPFKYPVVYLNTGKKIKDYEELYLMSLCKHAIIPNSTFHWWAAWLINNQIKIVIRPKLWFADSKPIDIYPPEWITVEEDKK